MPGQILPWMSDLASNGKPEGPVEIRYQDGIQELPKNKSDELNPSGIDNSRPTPNTHLSPERLAQLTASLRTRLTFAFVKIQNGWATHSLDQLETLAQTGTDDKKIERSQSASVAQVTATTNNNRIKKHRMHRRFNSDLSMLNIPDGPRVSPKKSKHKRPSSISIPTVSLEIPESTEPNEADAVESLMFLSSPHSSHTVRFPSLH
jgi:G1-specific transcriptional repressor WHI5